MNPGAGFEAKKFSEPVIYKAHGRNRQDRKKHPRKNGRYYPLKSHKRSGKARRKNPDADVIDSGVFVAGIKVQHYKGETKHFNRYDNGKSF